MNSTARSERSTFHELHGLQNAGQLKLRTRKSAVHMKTALADAAGRRARATRLQTRIQEIVPCIRAGRRDRTAVDGIHHILMSEVDTCRRYLVEPDSLRVGKR